MREIQLTKGKVTLVDDEDYEWLSEFKWQAENPRVGLYYAVRRVYVPNGKAIFKKMHREILSVPSDMHVDHRDGNGLNNQRYNIRPCTQAENNRNARLRIDNSSGFKGVGWHNQRNKWVAYIRQDGRLKHLGLFATAEEGARAYDAAAREIFGEFAWLNFNNQGDGHA